MKRLLAFVFAVTLLGSCNKPGCTDPDAVNYDSSANDEDGTCQYVPTLSTMPIIYDGESLFADGGGILTADGGSDVALRGLCWSTLPNPTVEDDTTINGAGIGQFTSRMENLEFNTTYYVRAYATNSNGTGYGDELIFITASLISIPDPNFEQALIDLSIDDIIDGFVLPSNVSSVVDLDVGGKNIYDLTGIEAFTSLRFMNCSGNQLTSLDVSNNVTLEIFRCFGNQLTSLDVSQNTALYLLNCGNNQLTSLDVSQNTALFNLMCEGNQLTSLDVSNNVTLEGLNCMHNSLTCLNLKNGNNYIMTAFVVFNPNLTCIEVDDPNWTTQNWTTNNGQWTYSTNCNYPAGCF